jgi:hypothetical protein
MTCRSRELRKWRRNERVKNEQEAGKANKIGDNEIRRIQ